MEIPDVKVPHDNLLAYDDMQIPIPSDSLVRRYPCDFCNKRFTQKARLMQHMMLNHSTERPKECNLCGLKFTKRSDLTNHLKRHAYPPPQEDPRIDPLAPDGEHNIVKNRRKKPTNAAPRKRKAPVAKQVTVNDSMRIDMNRYIIKIY